MAQCVRGNALQTGPLTRGRNPLFDVTYQLSINMDGLDYLQAANPLGSLSNRLTRRNFRQRVLGQEPKSNYSITSSARPNSVGGIVIPSAFAVLRLIDNIILVGNSTGSSPGGVPCRILSAK